MKRFAVVVAALACAAPSTAAAAPSGCGVDNGLFGAYAGQAGLVAAQVEAARAVGLTYGELQSAFRRGGACTP